MVHLLSPSHIQMWRVEDAEREREGEGSDGTGGTNGTPPIQVYSGGSHEEKK